VTPACTLKVVLKLLLHLELPVQHVELEPGVTTAEKIPTLRFSGYWEQGCASLFRGESWLGSSRIH
jgi:hypothetical protein